MIFRLLILLGIFLVSPSAFGQDEEDGEGGCKKTTNKKLLSELEKAKKENDWSKCKDMMDKLLEANPTFPEGYLFLAQRAKRKMEYITAIKAYEQLITNCPTFSALPYFDLGTYYFDKKDYLQAMKFLKEYRKHDQAKEGEVLYADSLLRISKLMSEPVPFDPKPVSGICSPKDEYLAMISADKEVAIYTRGYDKLRRGDLIPSRVEEFTISRINPGQDGFSDGEEMPPPFNRSENEGGPSITLDNNKLFFTRCVDKAGYNNCDIWYCEFKDGKWGEIKNMGPEINMPNTWDSQPCISRDGRILYFASDRNESMKMDLYISRMDEKGKWSPAEPMGKPFNTHNDEKSPFLHPDSRTFYFSSKGHAGLGGYDIYYCKIDSTGSFGKPKNIGYPINSQHDEVGFFVSTDGQTGYFASNKLKSVGKGGYDVYSFPLYEAARPSKVLFVKGDLKKDDLDTLAPAASVELRNIKTNEVTKLSVDSSSGKYVGVVNFESDYVLSMKKEGYAFESNYFSVADSQKLRNPVTFDMDLVKVSEGKAFQLDHIFYKTNSAELEEKSMEIIREFSGYMKVNPNLKVEIRGHTDNVGDDAKNMALSTDRAFTVFDLLQQYGIDKARVSFKGFGESKPIAPNDNEDGRAKNRRTEFYIVKK